MMYRGAADIAVVNNIRSHTPESPKSVSENGCVCVQWARFWH